MLALLHTQATTDADRLAYVLHDRDVSYRRLWSRIERGSARLHGEWGVRRGDTVAYVGCGHPGAIVLYFALLRIGATLLPLERVPLSAMSALCADRNVTLAVHDDDYRVPDLPARRLEDLLAVWSHHDPLVAEDDDTCRALWLPAEDGEFQPTSLLELCADLPEWPRTTCVNDRLFTRDVLRHIVLPSLVSAQQMQFAATPVALQLDGTAVR